MRYPIAILHTIGLIIFPLFMIAFLQWYKKTLVSPDTDLIGIYMIIGLISIGFIVMTIFRWFSAIHDKDIKNLL